jgi:hypothetical protein
LHLPASFHGNGSQKTDRTFPIGGLEEPGHRTEDALTVSHRSQPTVEHSDNATIVLVAYQTSGALGE